MKSTNNIHYIKKPALITSILVFVCLISGLSQNAEASGTFRVTKGVNVRSSASTDADSLATVNEGSSVDVIEHNPAGWSKVQTGNTVGFIRSDFLKLVIGDTPAAFRATAGVHIREMPSTSANSLATVNQDESVQVLEHDPAGWSKVQAGNITGYIRSDFLKHAGTATAASVSVSAEETVLGEYKTTGSDINMRKDPSTNAAVLKKLAKDVAVEVLDIGTNGWSRVTHGGDTGYVRSDFLAPASAAAASNETVETKTRYIAGTVNFRSEPSTATSANVYRSLVSGTAVEVVEDRSDGWSRVIHNDKEGYIKTEFLTTSVQGETKTRYTTDTVRLRAKATTSSSILKLLSPGTAVTVLADESNGWSNVKHGDTTGYIRSDLLSDTAQISNTIIATMIVTERQGANVRSGPGTSYNKVATLPYGSTVTVYAHESNGWSRVKAGNIEGYIRSDLLGNGAPVELVTMSDIKHLLPYKENIRVVDVRTGVSYNIKIYSKGTHADYETSTRADTDAMFSVRGGVRSWAARPLWVYVGNRVFAAASHGMPHDVSFISDNGLDGGHLCLHFHNTTASNKTYQSDLRRAVQEAYDKRP